MFNIYKNTYIIVSIFIKHFGKYCKQYVKVFLLYLKWFYYCLIYFEIIIYAKMYIEFKKPLWKIFIA